MPRIHVDRVVNDLYLLRLDDDETKYFEALWSIPEGVTYNSYVLATSEGAVVFDTWKARYSELYLEALREVVDLKDIRYLVVHHVEPDHSGVLPKLLEALSSRPTVIGHPLARNLLNAFYGIDTSFKAVKDLEALTIGDKKLKFVYIPWLHWPETIATYIEELKVLLTCDAFGGFGVPPTLYDEDDVVVETYMPMVRKYIVTVVGHYREYISKAIEKLKSLGIEISIVAPSHGLVWKRRPHTVIEYYDRIARAEPIEKKVVVVYSSMYGFVEQIMNIVVEELSSYGFAVKVFSFRDDIRAELSDILSEAIDSYAIVIGASTYENRLFPEIEYVIDMLIHKINAEKSIIAIAVYGWGAIAEQRLRKLFEKSRFELLDVIAIRGKPTNKDIERIRNAIAKIVSRT